MLRLSSKLSVMSCLVSRASVLTRHPYYNASEAVLQVHQSSISGNSRKSLPQLTQCLICGTIRGWFTGARGAGMVERAGFAERLREVRAAAGLSQTGLAERSGVAASTIRQFEQSRREPTYGTLLKLARGLGVSLS